MGPRAAWSVIPSEGIRIPNAQPVLAEFFYTRITLKIRKYFVKVVIKITDTAGYVCSAEQK
jgi:hypothetical protein